MLCECNLSNFLRCTSLNSQGHILNLSSAQMQSCLMVESWLNRAKKSQYDTPIDRRISGVSEKHLYRLGRTKVEEYTVQLAETVLPWCLTPDQFLQVICRVYKRTLREVGGRSRGGLDGAQYSDAYSRS